jgi:hypothetical protein
VLRDAVAAGQTRRAVVAGSCIDLTQPIAQRPFLGCAL